MVASLWRTKATQKWGERARWLSGEGPFAVIAPCREFSFSLWVTREAADKAKDGRVFRRWNDVRAFKKY